MAESSPQSKSSSKPEYDPASFRLLVVDNEAAHARAMTESLEKVGYKCTVATSGPEAATLIQRDTFDIIITDMVMNDVDGMKLLKMAAERLPDCEVVMVTGHATVPIAVEAMQEGAFNFLEKPITPNRLRAIVEKAVGAVSLRRQNTELMSRLDERFGFEGIVYASKKMQQVIDRVPMLAIPIRSNAAIELRLVQSIDVTSVRDPNTRCSTTWLTSEAISRRPRSRGSVQAL